MSNITSSHDIAIIDYGMGNLRSIHNAIKEVGGTCSIVSAPQDLKKFPKAILPGVGAFQDAIHNIRSTGFADSLNSFIEKERYLLGICLGMQLMCIDSLEDGKHKGLGWFDAHVKPLPKKEELLLPQMGWNGVKFLHSHEILNGVESDCDYYFLHSYYVDCCEDTDIFGTTEYGITFPSIIAKRNLIGMQFHPEKSQSLGLRLMQNFINL